MVDDGSESASKATKGRFATDAPVPDLAERDYFGHRAYSEVLADALLDAEPPFSIALIGPWGIGKTSIANSGLARALTARARGVVVAFAYFDVWKYEDSIRRQFLRELAEQFARQKRLGKEFDLKRDLQDLEIEHTETKEEPPRLDRNRIFPWLWRASLTGVGIAAALVLVLIAFGAASIDQLGDEWKRALFGFIAGAIISLARDAASLVTTREVQFTRQPITDADQFASKFAHLLASVTADRVVIVLDNLDRCDAPRAVEMLDSIKTFLEPETALKPLFVVPCDMGAIRAHLLAVRGSLEADADEYLRKFFNANLRITPFLDLEMRRLVEAELDRLHLNDALTAENRDGLLRVVVSAFRRNPRRVKQFLNDVVLKQMVLIAREEKGEIKPAISQEVAFIAKMTALEQEWRVVYELVEQDDRAYEQLSALSQNLRVQAPRVLMEALESRPALRDFLRATKSVESRVPWAFVRLKLAPEELELPGFRQFRDAIIDGRSEAVSEVLSPETAERYRQIAVTLLRAEVRNAHLDGIRAIISTIAGVELLVDPNTANESADALDRFPALFQDIHLFEPRPFLALMAVGTGATTTKALDEAISFVTRQDLISRMTDEVRPAWLEAFGQGIGAIWNSLSPRQQGAVREALSAAPEVARLPFLVGLSSTESGVNVITTEQTALLQALQKLDASSFSLAENGEPVFRNSGLLWSRTYTGANPDAVGALVDRSSTLLATGEPSLVRAIVELLVLTRDSLSVAPIEGRARLAQLIVQHYASLSIPRHAALLAVDALAPPDSSVIVTVANNLANDPPQGLAALTEPNIAALLSSTAQSALAQGLVVRSSQLAGSDLEVLLVALFDLAADLGWQWPAQAIDYAISNGQMQAVTAAVQARRDILNKVQPEVIDHVHGQLMDRAQQSSWPQWQQYLDHVFALASDLTPEACHRLIILLATWSEAADAATRLEALRLVQEGGRVGALTPNDLAAIAEHVAGHVGRSQFDATWEPVIRWAIDTLGPRHTEAVTAMFDGLIRIGSGNIGARPFAARLVAVLPSNAARSEAAVTTILDWADAHPDEGEKQVLIEVATQFAGKDKRRRAYRVMRDRLNQG